MSHRCRRSSNLWKVREPGEDQRRSLSPMARGCRVCWGPLHLQSALTCSILPRSWCGMRLSSRARSTSSPPTATAPRSTASAPSAPARSRAGREWGSQGAATPRCCGTSWMEGGWRMEVSSAFCHLSHGAAFAGERPHPHGAQRALPQVLAGWWVPWGSHPPLLPLAGGQASSTAASRGSSSCWSAASTRAGRRGAAATPTTWRGCAPSAPSPAL